MKKNAIILVDDEAEILENSIYLQIRNYFNKYIDIDIISCKTTRETRELVEYLDSEGIKIPLFIIDEVMKGSPETGNDLIKYLDQTHPKARKILLSGQATPEEIITALNDAGVDIYIPKKDIIVSSEKLIKIIDKLFFEYTREEGIKFLVKDKDGTEIIIRAAETLYDIHQAAKLVYFVYNDVEKRFREGVLTEEQIKMQEKWDSADFTSDGKINPFAKHFVAIKGGECIGCVRIWMDKGPLDGFDFGTGDNLTLRVGKWMIHPDYRISLLPVEIDFEDKLSFRSPIAIPLLIHVFISTKYEFKENELFLSCRPQLKTMYSKLGFKQVNGPFINPILKGDDEGEYPGYFIGMKMNIDETYLEYLEVKAGVKKQEETDLNITLLDYILLPLKSSKIKNYISEYKSPWERYYGGIYE